LQALGRFAQAVKDGPRHPTRTDLPDRMGACDLVVGLHVRENPLHVGLTDRL
jgi:hypothetical protein